MPETVVSVFLMQPIPLLSHPGLEPQKVITVKCGDVWPTDVGLNPGCVHVYKETLKRMLCAFILKRCTLMVCLMV